MVERRLIWLAGIVLVWGGAIFAKLVTLQVVHHQEYVKKARARQEEVVQLRAQRGAILDRTGHPLAMSVPTEAVSVDPRNVPSIGLDSDLLARQLHLPPAELFSRLQAAHDERRGFYLIKKDLTPQEAEDVRNLKADWIHVDDASERHYPNNQLAAHLLGGVDFEEKGNGGIEKALEPQLHGTPGRADILTDVHHHGIFELVSNQAQAGVAVTLTIDERLQFVAEREVAAAVKEHGAVSGSVVVMNPYNGEILALASYPTFDPNIPPTTQEEVEARSNHAVGVPFEPGSCFKVITLAAALETTRLRPESSINCHGGVLSGLPGGRVIHDSHTGMGVVPMVDVLAHSSNVGAIEVGRTVGRENLYNYVRRFGFGDKTGIPLPGESKGRVRGLPKWGSTSLESVSMGQEVSVTTLQLARAVSVIANGGLLVQPRLVMKMGEQAPPMEPPVRAIKPETAITMRQMMEAVVLYGTGKTARVPGYTTGGKTGTAQIFDFATKRYTHTYNGSFMGFAPVTNPAVIAVVTLNGTRGNLGFGAEVAIPTWKAVVAEALRILDVPKDLPDTPETPTQIAQNQKDAGVNDLAIADLGSDRPNILLDTDDDEAAAPKAIAFVGPIAPGATPTAPAPAAPPAPVAGTVPNFKGMTLRAVLTAAAAKGLPIQPDGTGVARLQSPPPGAVLHQGERIRVQFAR
jgi:cell division protein FtsI (penicillin-binding protein 3)